MNSCLSSSTLTTAFIMSIFYLLHGGLTDRLDLEECQSSLLSRITEKSTYSDDVILNAFHQALLENFDLVYGLEYSVNVTTEQDASVIFLIVYTHGQVSLSSSKVNDDKGTSDPQPLPDKDELIECLRFVSSSKPSTMTWTAPASNEASGCVSIRPVVQRKKGDILEHGRPVTLCPPSDSDCRFYRLEEYGWISSPGFPQQYPDNADCIFSIIGQPGASIDVQFQAIQLEPAYSGKCVDYVVLSASDVTSPRYCGQYSEGEELRGHRYLSEAQFLRIEFHSDSKISDTGFKLFFAVKSPQECNYYLTETTGSFSSPSYPSPYLPNTLCKFHIRLPASYRVIFTILDLDFGKSPEIASSKEHHHPKQRQQQQKTHQQTSFSEDYISITDLMSNTSTILECQSQIITYTDRTVFESSSSSIDVLFSSDHFLQGRGFKISYKGVPSCKNESLSGSSGIIVSPNYPNKYPNNQRCFYEIKTSVQSEDVAPGVSLQLKFSSMFTESDDDDSPLRDDLCTKDYIHISSRGTEHRVCGNWSGKEHILTFQNLPPSLTVRFVSDDQVTKTGFSLEWSSQPTNPSLQECLPHVVNADNTHFEVIYNPLNWADAETDCRSRGGHLAKVEDMGIQDLLADRIDDVKNKCQNKDSFWIGANDRQWESDFYWVSGGKTEFTNWFPGWVQSQSSQKQPSDDGLSNEDCVELRRQFHLPWKGTRDAGGYYWNDRDCEEKNPYICGRITNRTITESSKCDRHIDLVQRFTPSRDSAVNNNNNNNNNITTTTNNNSPTTNEDEEGDGERNDVELFEQKGTVTLSSPDYPNNYEDFLNCTITITSPAGTGIMLEMDTFWLEGPDDTGKCVYDSLSFDPFLDASTGSLSEHKSYCGNWAGREKKLHQVIGQNTAALTFRSDHSRSFKGFRAKAWILDSVHFCGEGDWLFMSGVCIMAPPLATTLEMVFSDCQSKMADVWMGSDVNLINRLEVLKGLLPEEAFFWDTQKSDLSKNLCAVVNVSMTSLEHENAQLVVGRQSNTACNAKHHYMCRKAPMPYGFQPWRQNLSFTSPGNLTLVELFNTTTTTVNYKDLAQVLITLKAPENHQILIALSNVNIEPETNCVYDFVEIKNSSLNQRICGNLSKNKLIYAVSEFNDTDIYFESDYSISGKGMDITWSWINLDQCHREYSINSSSSFQITSFNYPKPYPATINCSLSIQSTEEYPLLAVIFDSVTPLDVINGAELILEADSISKMDGHSGHQKVAYTVNSSLFSDSLIPVLVSNTGYLHLKYQKPDGYGIDEGFTATVKTGSGILTLPTRIQELQVDDVTHIYNIGYPSQASTGFLQDIILRAPVGYNIQVSLIDHDDFPKRDCKSQYIQFDDVSVAKVPETEARRSEGDPFKAKRVDTWCTPDVNANVTSELNRLRVRISYGSTESTKRGLRFVIFAAVVKDLTFLKKTRYDYEFGFDLCKETPCLHGGVCKQDGGVAKCVCEPRYGGMFCQDLWCALSPCGHGWCNMTSSGFVCTCHADYFGVTCDLDEWGCASYICNGRGRCMPGNQTHPTCKCSGDWTGIMCANRVEEGDESLSLGQRLLKEPIWIGLIVILSVLLTFGVSYIIRRKCGKYFRCCDIKKPRIDDNILNADGTIALNSFPLRRYNRPSFVSLRKSSVTAFPGTHTVTIKTDTDSDAALSPTPTPSGKENGEAAARFFASYKNADKNPIATPLTTDFTRTTDTSLSQEVGDASVGAMVGGRLLFDLHIRENKAKAREDSTAMGRTTSLMTHSRHQEQSRGDRMKRSHSTGPFLVRQETQYDEFAVSNPHHIYPHVIVEKRDSDTLTNGISRKININDLEDELSLREIKVTVPVSQINDNGRQTYANSSGARVIEVNLDGESEGHETTIQVTPDLDDENIPSKRSRSPRLKSHKRVVSLGDEETLSREIEKLMKYRNFIKEWKTRTKNSYSIASSSLSLNDEFEGQLNNRHSLDSDNSKKSSKYVKKRNRILEYPLRRTRTVDDVGMVTNVDVTKKREKYSKKLNHSSESLDDPNFMKRHHHHNHYHNQQQSTHRRDGYRARKHSSYHSSWDIPEYPDDKPIDDVEFYRRFRRKYDWTGVNSVDGATGIGYWSHSNKDRMTSSTSDPSFLVYNKSDTSHGPPSRQSTRTHSRQRKAKRSRHSSSRSARSSRHSQAVHESSSESDTTILANRKNGYSNIRLPHHGILSVTHETSSKPKSKVKTQSSHSGHKPDTSKTSEKVTIVSEVEKPDVFSTVFSQEIEIDDFSPVEDNIDLETLKSNSKSKDTILSTSLPHLYINDKLNHSSISSNQYLSVNLSSDVSHSHTDSEIDYKSKQLRKSSDNSAQILSQNTNNECSYFHQASQQVIDDRLEKKSRHSNQNNPNSPSSCKVIVYNSNGKESEKTRPAIVNTRHLLTRKHSSLDLMEPHSKHINSTIRSAASLQELSSTGTKEQQQIVITLSPSYQSNSRRGSITNMPFVTRKDSDKRTTRTPQTPTNSLSIGVESVDNLDANSDIERHGHLNAGFNAYRKAPKYKEGSGRINHDDKKDTSLYLSVTDTDSAMSSAPSHNSTPTGRKGKMLSAEKSYSYETKVKDSAYETKQSSLEADAYLESKGLKTKAPVRVEDRRVTQRLHQAAVKLFIIQQRVKKARQHLSRDSAIHTISEDDPSLDDIIVTNSKSWTYKPGVLYPAHSEGDENNPESHPVHCDRILEEQDCRVEYEV